MNKNWIHKAKIYVIITVMLLSFYLPLLPNSLFTPIVHAAGITPDESTVDSTVPLSVSPTLAGENKWYYNGLTAITDGSTGATLGSVYRYISENGEKRNMVKGTDATKWANALAEDANFVFNNFEKSAQKYLFTPPSSTNKSAFDRYLISNLFDAAGITYQSTGSEIRITKPVAPKISTFKVKESPNASGKYPLYSDITIQFTIEEYLEKYDTLRNVQVYGKYEGQPNAFKIGEVPTFNTSAGAYTGEFTYTLASNEDLTLYIRAYDAVNQLDENSKNGETLGSFGKFYKMSGKISTELDVTQDGQPIQMYDYTDATTLRSINLSNGLMGRQNGKMRQHPNNNIGWFGPVRYPTIYLGNSADGGTKTAVNTSFQAEGQSEQIKTISAFQKPFMYILGPIDANFAKPDGKVHDSIETSTFTIQKTSQFSSADIEKMFNGNPTYVLSNTPEHSITTAAGKNLGNYYWLRELAESSGGDVNNTCTAENDTCLNIIQTSYPDISKFDFKSTNTYTSANQPISFDFEGFEYVSASRTGATRNKTAWEIEVLSAPSEGQVGEKVTGTVFSNKLADNAAKSSMKKYDGKYASTSLAKFTPKSNGDYLVRLTVTDEVQRSTKSGLLSFKIGPGGGPGGIVQGGEPILKITPPTQKIKSGETASYVATYTNEVGQSQVVTAQANWSIANSSLASNDGKGLYTGTKQGTTTVTVEHKGLTASAQLIVEEGFTKGLRVTPPSQSVMVGRSTSYKAIYTDDNGNETDVTQQSFWGGGGMYASSMNAKGHYEGEKIGDATIMASYNGLKAEAAIEVYANPFIPPVAIIKAPTTVEVGETFCLDGRDSYDVDGEIERYYWTVHGMKNANGQVENEEAYHCGNYYETIGEKLIVLQVDDNEGNWGYTEHKIIVTEPKPSASFNIGGYLKENRHVTINPSEIYGDSANYERFPIVKHVWTVKPLGDLTSNDYRTVQSIQSGQHFSNYNQVIDFLSKKVGKYEVTRYVESNIGLTDTVTKIIDISADLKPITNFNFDSLLVYRDANKNATIKVNDNSYSSDGDTITKRIWTLRYDSDNDGDFNDESVETLSDANVTSINKTVNKVGKYLVELEVWETFGEPTLPQFVNLSENKNVTDRRYNDTSTKTLVSKVIEIDNVQPFSSFEASPIKEINVEIDLADSPYTQSDVLNVLPYFNQLLRAGNLKAHVTFAEQGLEKEYIINARSTVTHNGNNYVSNKMSVLVKGNRLLYRSISDYTTNTSYTTRKFEQNIKKVIALNKGLIILLENGSAYFFGEIEGRTVSNSVYRNNISSFEVFTPKKIDLPKIKNIYAYANTILATSRFVYFEDYNGKLHLKGSFSRLYDDNSDNSIHRNPDLNTYEQYPNNFEGFFEGGIKQQDNYKDIFYVETPYSSYTATFNIPFVNSSVDTNFWFKPSNVNDIVANMTGGNDGTNTGNTFSKFKNYENKTFTVKMSNQTVNAEELLSDLTGISTTFIGMGTSLNQEALNTVKNSKGGKVVNLSIPKNANTNMNTLANAILELYAQDFGTNDMYVVLGEEMNYITTQDDTENDSIVKSRWKFKHNEKVFADNLGKDALDNQYINEPISQFTKVGLYNPIFTVLDNPLANINVSLHEAFDKYPKWSAETNSVNIYVHRKPNPDFSLTLNSATRKATIINKAYDLDLCGNLNGLTNVKCVASGTGIKEQKWHWRYFGEIAWRNGLPSNPVDLKKIYEIRNTVTDYQGATESLIKEMSGLDLPPVADFEPIPSTIFQEEQVQLLNMSYEPNGQDMTATWKYRKKGTTDWTTHSTNGAFTNGNGNTNWSPKTNVFTEVGFYEVHLTVSDVDGNTDGTMRELEVLELPNKPPVAKFITDKTTYSDWETVQITNQSTDVDGDSMTAKWQVKLKNSADSTYKQFATGSYNGVTNTALTGWHTTLKQTILDNNMKCSSQTTNCEYTIKLTVSDGTEEDSTTRNITFLKIFEIPNAQEKISGNFHWELQRVANMKHPNLAIQAKPQVDSTHAAIRNIKYGYDIAACTTKEATATTKEVIVPLDCLVSDLSKIKSMKDGKVTFHLEYEYTNHYTQVTGSTEKLPVWETEYVKTFKLADAVGVEKNELTLPFGYPIEKEISLNSFEDLKTGYTVGRDLVIDLTATDRVKQQEYKEYLITNDEHKMKYDLKSQTRLPLWLPSLEYKVSVPSKSQLNNTYNPFIEGFSTGTFTTLDMDENLKDLYKKGQKYELPLQQANITKIGFVPVTNEAKYKFDYLSDLFFISKHTGYMLRNPLTEIMVKVNEPAYANIKLNQNLINIDTMENMMKLAYQNDYGVPLVDTITTTELKDTQYYYLPVSLTTIYEPKEEYVNEYVLNNVGLNNITLKFNQEFSFENYMFGDILDEPIFAEQQAPEISIENYPHTVIISDEKLQSLATYINSDNVLIHQFRTGHRELMKKAYDYLK